jgi:single-strand DNA-binding protein
VSEPPKFPEGKAHRDTHGPEDFQDGSSEGLMSGTVNKVILIGRLGRDPEVKYTPSGAPVAKFTLATDESFKDRAGEQQKKTEWHNIVAWNKLAEICGEYLTKGKLVYIEGSIRSNQWEDQSGNKKTSYEIVARNMQMLGSKAETERSYEAAPADSSAPRRAENPPSAPEPAPEAGITDEDIPF